MSETLFLDPLPNEEKIQLKKWILTFIYFIDGEKITRFYRIRDKNDIFDMSPNNNFIIRLQRDNSLNEFEKLDPEILLSLYKENPFSLIKPIRKKSDECFFLSFDTEWDEVEDGPDLHKRVNILKQLSWVVYDHTLQEIKHCDFHDKFDLGMMTLACDLAEYIPTVIGCNIVPWEEKERTGFDIPALKRFYPKHPVFNLINICHNFDIYHSFNKGLDKLLMEWTGRHKSKEWNSLQDARDTFEVFWRAISNKKLIEEKELVEEKELCGSMTKKNLPCKNGKGCHYHKK